MVAARHPTVELAPASSVEAQRCLTAYFAELQERFDHGFDPALGSAYVDADMTPPKGWFVLARIDGEAVGCGVLIRLDDRTGEIKRVWISQAFRGQGVASRIMDRLENLARENGIARVVLDTNRALKEARAMYLKRGYREIARYNDNPYADHWFEKALSV